MTTTIMRFLLLFAVVVGVCNAEDNYDDDKVYYVESWSWAIFAVFMWLVPQLSIIIGDFRESLFNSKKWNIPRKTKNDNNSADKFYTKRSTSPDTAEEEGVAVEEEGPIVNDNKENVVLADDEDEQNEQNDEEQPSTVDHDPAKADGNKSAQSVVGNFVKTLSTQALNLVTKNDGGCEEKKMCPKLQDGLDAVRKSALITICIWLVLIVAAAIGISLGTQGLDERMVLVLEGLSRVFGAFVMSLISFTIPFWCGLYFATYSDRSRNLGNGSIKELSFNVRWALHRPFFSSFIVMLPFFEGVTDAKIPVSIFSGIATGFIVDASVYFARRFESRLRRNVAIGLFAAIWGAGSALVMADGAWFIAHVWKEGDPDSQWIFSFFVFVGWFSLLFVGHMIRLWHSRRRRQQAERKLGLDRLNESTSANPTAAARPRMATSLIMGRMKGGMTSNAQDLKGQHGWESRRRTDADDDTLRKPPTVRDLETDLAGIQEDNENREDTSDNAGYDEDNIEGTIDRKKAARFEDEHEASTVEKDHSCDIEEPTYREMMKNYTCCGCVKGSDKTWLEKTVAFIAWTVWWILILGSLYVVAVNLGATFQQEAARAKLPYVARTLYDSMDEGPVCAFDNKGPDSNITTFPDKDAAHAEGFLVVHCGACAACSDWHNLRLEYTTRDYLAKESARCARKSLLGGADAVTSCLEKPPIGFQGQCAVCWTEDILCTKKYCAIIYLQSIFINTVGNFEVGAETITSAACEEAHCEAGNPGDFVYCSGATRRRMNVTSTIARPGAQRCGIVDVEWAEVFPE